MPHTCPTPLVAARLGLRKAPARRWAFSHRSRRPSAVFHGPCRSPRTEQHAACLRRCCCTRNVRSGDGLWWSTVLAAAASVPRFSSTELRKPSDTCRVTSPQSRPARARRSRAPAFLGLSWFCRRTGLLRTHSQQSVRQRVLALGPLCYRRYRPPTPCSPLARAEDGARASASGSVFI